MDDMLRTPADGTRLRILAWLGEPDTAGRGLTAGDVAACLGVPRTAALAHLRLLTSLGLLRLTGQDDDPRYHRDEIRLAEVTQLFEKGW
ncbi:helix-turn-helix domain-containing protein [Streptomyces albogriseolus]